MEWFVKHYMASKWPAVTSNDKGVTLVVQGGTREQAESIAAKLNGPIGTVTVTGRQGDIAVTVTGPSREVVEDLLASFEAESTKKVEHATLAEEAANRYGERIEVLTRELETWKQAAIQRGARVEELTKQCDGRAETVRRLDAENRNLEGAVRDLRSTIDSRDAVIEDLRRVRDQRATEAQGLQRELENWEDTAEQFARNVDYYRDIVDRCARAIGPEAFTCDDGSVSESPLRAKVAALVEKLAAESTGTSHRDIVGALVDFAAWLTTSPNPVTFSAWHDAARACEAVQEFAAMRGLNLDNADVEHWQEVLQQVGEPEVTGSYPEILRKLADTAEGRIWESVTRAMRGAASELDALYAMTSCTMGVGGGDGSLFVHGTHESIKAAQRRVLQAEEWEKAAREYRSIIDKAVEVLPRKLSAVRISQEDARRSLALDLSDFVRDATNAPQAGKPVPATPLMRTAVSWTDGSSSGYRMIFAFKSMNELHAAAKEWYALEDFLGAQQ
jgi:hypothetical protein